MTRIPGDRRRSKQTWDPSCERRDPAPPVENDTNTGDQAMAIAGDRIPIIASDFVDAVCIKIERHYFQMFKQPRWVFTFAVAYPERYSNLNLQMFIRDRPIACRSSKLYKSACLANGGPLRPRQQITDGMFLNRMFRCKTRLVVPKIGDPYSVIDELVEKLTG
jgi:hypothetical protein